MKFALAAVVVLLVLAASACPPPPAAHVDAGPPPGAIIHIKKGGDGHGGVTSVPDGIDCDQDCLDGADETFTEADSTISLTATAARDALFSNWHCDGSKDGQPLTSVDVEDATLAAVHDDDPQGIELTCTASFRQLRTVLVIFSGTGTGHVTGTAASSDGTGTRIDCPSKCTAGYFNGDTETLTAVADPGSTFNTWKLDCQGTDPATLTLDDDKTCEARFCLSDGSDCGP